MITLIGAGPVGSYVASLLAEDGQQVRIVEEHKDVGEPVRCTGLVTADINRIVKVPNNVIVNRISKIKVVAPNKDELNLKLRKPELVLDRTAFDKWLFKQALDAGAEALLHRRFIDYKAGKVVARNEKTNRWVRWKTALLIGADGPISRVARVAGILGRRQFYIGMQTVVEGAFQKHSYIVFLGSRFPGFFGWIVPESSSRARVGMASHASPTAYFNDLLREQGFQSKRIQSGLIPIYNPKLKVQKKNLFLVGDAACQVKATTGGGIIPGLRAAQILGNSIIRNNEYEKGLFQVRRDLWLHLKVREMLNRFTDSDYNRLIRYCKGVGDILGSGNRESPLPLLLKLIIRNPRFLRFAKIIDIRMSNPFS